MDDNLICCHSNHLKNPASWFNAESLFLSTYPPNMNMIALMDSLNWMGYHGNELGILNCEVFDMGYNVSDDFVEFWYLLLPGKGNFGQNSIRHICWFHLTSRPSNGQLWRNLRAQWDVASLHCTNILSRSSEIRVAYIMNHENMTKVFNYICTFLLYSTMR